MARWCGGRSSISATRPTRPTAYSSTTGSEERAAEYERHLAVYAERLGRPVQPDERELGHEQRPSRHHQRRHADPADADPAHDAMGYERHQLSLNTQVIGSNASVISQLLGGDVRRNYFQLGTTWTIGGAAPNGANEVGDQPPRQLDAGDVRAGHQLLRLPPDQQGVGEPPLSGGEAALLNGLSIPSPSGEGLGWGMFSPGSRRQAPPPPLEGEGLQVPPGSLATHSMRAPCGWQRASSLSSPPGHSLRRSVNLS